MRKLGIAALGVGLVALAGWWVAGVVLDRVSREVVRALVAREDAAFLVRELAFDDVSLTSPRAATWRGIRGVVERASGGEQFEVAVSHATVRVTGTDSAVLEVDALVVTSTRDAGSRVRGASFEGNRVRLPVAVDLLDPQPALRETAREALRFARAGATSAPIELDGRVTLEVRGKQEEVRIGVAKSNGAHVLVADPGDVARVSSLFHERPTPAEIELISRHALRAPRLLQIADEAESTARKAHREDPRVPEDAYRHVLWSYLIAREFGPVFAEQLTDAHEERPHNDANERRMDVTNNAVGRDYAARGVPQSEILERVQRDARVVRDGS